MTSMPGMQNNAFPEPGLMLAALTASPASWRRSEPTIATVPLRTGDIYAIISRAGFLEILDHFLQFLQAQDLDDVVRRPRLDLHHFAGLEWVGLLPAF